MNSPNQKLTSFKGELVEFIESTKVVAGVTCDVYRFVDDSQKDLGIIYINAGCSTPKQKVLKGDRTIEGYISGNGKLIVTGQNGKQQIYQTDKDNLSVDVKIGEIMQWQATTDLVAYEICYPPYQDGRYQNL